MDDITVINGRPYHYDSEMDRYIPVAEPLGPWDQWGWILAIIVLAVFSYLVEYG